MDNKNCDQITNTITKILNNINLNQIENDNECTIYKKKLNIPFATTNLNHSKKDKGKVNTKINKRHIFIQRNIKNDLNDENKTIKKEILFKNKPESNINEIHYYNTESNLSNRNIDIISTIKKKKPISNRPIIINKVKKYDNSSRIINNNYDIINPYLNNINYSNINNINENSNNESNNNYQPSHEFSIKEINNNKNINTLSIINQNILSINAEENLLKNKKLFKENTNSFSMNLTDKIKENKIFINNITPQEDKVDSFILDKNKGKDEKKENIKNLRYSQLNTKKHNSLSKQNINSFTFNYSFDINYLSPYQLLKGNIQNKKNNSLKRMRTIDYLRVWDDKIKK